MTIERFRPHRSSALMAALVVLVSAPLALAFKPVSTDAANVALSGFDAVAYWKEKKAVRGHAHFRSRWRGALWFFSSRGNRDAFAADPERFAPEFGGYCALGMGDGAGKGVACDPEAFFFVEDKLYLLKNKTVLGAFKKDPAKALESARVNWGRLQPPPSREKPAGPGGTGGDRSGPARTHAR